MTIAQPESVDMEKEDPQRGTNTRDQMYVSLPLPLYSLTDIFALRSAKPAEFAATPSSRRAPEKNLHLHIRSGDLLGVQSRLLIQLILLGLPTTRIRGTAILQPDLLRRETLLPQDKDPEQNLRVHVLSYFWSFQL
jgi:hypothetical protein